MQFRGADTITHLQDPKILIEKSRKVKITVNMTFKFSLTVSDNLQIFGFFLLKSVSRYALGLQTAPRVKIIHFTPSVHNILFEH
jgi:hypothetical protein